MLELCDLYLWKMNKPSKVYVINKPLEHNMALEIARTWVDICNGDYALVNTGHAPWASGNMPDIQSIEQNRVLILARKE